MSRITEIAKTMKSWWNEDDDPFVHHALDEIIRIDQEQAPNRRMSEELIRRSDAIKAIANLHILADEEKIFRVYANNPHSMTTDFEGTLIDAINAIKGIPTIEPKRGEWIDAEIPLESGGSMPIQVCNLCKTFYPLAYTGGGHRFCPNCGARMKGADDE